MSSEEKPPQEPFDIERLDPDKLLLSYSWRGYYQLFIIFCIQLIWMFMAFQAMSWAFIGLYHPFACVNNETLSANTTLKYGTVCTLPDNTTKCGGEGTWYEFDPSFGTTMTSEYELVCDHYTWAQFGTTLFTIGGLLGDVPVAQLADLYGRKWTFLICYWLAIGLTLGRVFIYDYTVGMAFYVLLGACTAGCTSTGFVLSCEMLTPNMRGTFLSMMENQIWVAGYILQGYIVYLIPDWRRMVFISNAPFMLSILFIWLLPESIHWLLAEQKYDEASKWVKRMTKLNCMTEKDVNLVDCMRTRIVAMLVYWALSLYSTQMSDDRFTGYYLSGVIEIPAGFMGPLLLMVIGRKTLVIMAHVVTAAGFIARILIPVGSANWITMSTNLLAKYGNILIWPGNFLLQAEVFPTTVRNLGYGLMAMFSGLGNMAAPFLGHYLTTNPKMGSAIFAAMCIVMCILTLALPETSNMELPVDIADTPLGPFLSRFVKKTDKNTNREQKLIEDC